MEESNANDFAMLALGVHEWKAFCPCHFPKWGSDPTTNGIREWVGLRAGLDALEKRKICFLCHQWQYS